MNERELPVRENVGPHEVQGPDRISDGREYPQYDAEDVATTHDWTSDPQASSLAGRSEPRPGPWDDPKWKPNEQFKGERPKGFGSADEDPSLGTLRWANERAFPPEQGRAAHVPRARSALDANDTLRIENGLPPTSQELSPVVERTSFRPGMDESWDALGQRNFETRQGLEQYSNIADGLLLGREKTAFGIEQLANVALGTPANMADDKLNQAFGFTNSDGHVIYHSDGLDDDIAAADSVEKGAAAMWDLDGPSTPADPGSA